MKLDCSTLRLPGARRVSTSPVSMANVICRSSGLSLLENPINLFFGESLRAYEPIPPVRYYRKNQSFAWRSLVREGYAKAGLRRNLMSR
jgi:hypothetical protein